MRADCPTKRRYTVESCNSRVVPRALVLAATLPAVALLVGGCTDARHDCRRGPESRPAGPPDCGLRACHGGATEQPRITPRVGLPRRLGRGGRRRSTDLVALSIGSYICGGRAAVPDQAVCKDFVFPMVHGDLDHLDAADGRFRHPVQHRLSAGTPR